MAIFNSYVKLPEGTLECKRPFSGAQEHRFSNVNILRVLLFKSQFFVINSAINIWPEAKNSDFGFTLL